MLNIIYIFLTISFVYSQCDYDNELQCSSDVSCEWHEDIQFGNCSNLLSGDECNAVDGCGWEYECFEYGWWYNWCYEGGYVCIGGAYQIDNGYCQEIEIQYQMGDINGDESVDVLDVIIITGLITDGEYNSIVDMNHDESTDVLDIILIINIILNTEN